MSVVKLVGRYEMANCPQPLQLVSQCFIKFDWRVKEKVTIRETHDCHSCSEGQRQPDSTHREVFEWSIDNPDMRSDWLIYVYWLVERGAHAGHLPDSFLHGVCLIA